MKLKGDQEKGLAHIQIEVKGKDRITGTDEEEKVRGNEDIGIKGQGEGI